jgi:hypothetical protein
MLLKNSNDIIGNKDDEDYILVAKGGRYQGLRNFPRSYADFLKIWEPPYPGKLRASLCLYRDRFTLFS